jgi:hypothetical protein
MLRIAKNHIYVKEVTSVNLNVPEKCTPQRIQGSFTSAIFAVILGAIFSF